jgi:hypothetical protein
LAEQQTAALEVTAVTAVLEAMVVQQMRELVGAGVAALAAQVMVAQEVKAETGNSLWVLTRFQMVAPAVQAVLAVLAVRVALPTATVVTEVPAEMAERLMVVLAEKDAMPRAHF